MACFLYALFKLCEIERLFSLTEGENINFFNISEETLQKLMYMRVRN